MTILNLLYLTMFHPVRVYLCGGHTALYYCTVYVVCACLPACLVCRAPLSLSVCLSDRLVCLPISLDSTQVSDSQLLRAVCVQPTVDEGEFGRAINSPLVVFHSVEGELCQGEDLTQGPNTVTETVKQI